MSTVTIYHPEIKRFRVEIDDSIFRFCKVYDEDGNLVLETQWTEGTYSDFEYALWRMLTKIFNKVPVTEDGYLVIKCPECGTTYHVKPVPSDLGAYREFYCHTCGWKVGVEFLGDDACITRIVALAPRKKPSVERR